MTIGYLRRSNLRLVAERDEDGEVAITVQQEAELVMARSGSSRCLLRVGAALFAGVLAGCSSGFVAPKNKLPEQAALKADDESASSSPISLERMTNRLGMGLRLIPAGEFKMGTTDAGPLGEFATCEQPQHVVRLTRPFWMSECEVTVGQFRRFVGATSRQ